MKATATTFQVSNVERGVGPLPEVPYTRAVEALLTPGISREQRRWVESIARSGYKLRVKKAPRFRPVEACSRYHGSLVGDVAYHPVVAAVDLAFSAHYPLTLSPDAVWLMIAQAVAHHVNARAEELRPKFVRHEGRLTICVRRDDFIKGSPENPWPEVFGALSAEVRGHVGPAADLFVPAFSTTGPAERAAADVVLLGATQSYFHYVVQSFCGIPEVRLEGTTEDWEALARRAEAFAEFGLGKWVGFLRPILGQFVRASKGQVDAPFWRSLYRLNGQSGGFVITGWITAFFPYLKDPQTGHAGVPYERFFNDEQGQVEDMLYPRAGSDREFARGPTAENLPGGLSAAPFRWDHNRESIPMEFLGGFVGVAQDPETLAVRPEIGWAVRLAGAPR